MILTDAAFEKKTRTGGLGGVLLKRVSIVVFQCTDI